MKKIWETVVMSFLLTIVLLAFIPTVRACAEEKSAAGKAAEQTGEAAVDDAKELSALEAYLAKLIKKGASQEEIDFANQCIEVVKERIAENMSEAEKKAAEEAMKEAQEAALKAYQEALEAAAQLDKEGTLAGSLEVAQSRDGLPRDELGGSVAGIILVGDSRFVETQNALDRLYGGTDVTIIAENSRGYKWLAENAIPRVDNIAGKGTRIVLNLGVNDLQNINKYIELVNAKAAEWTAKGATVYYATVNPVWGDQLYATEDGVKKFNEKLKAGLVGVNIIDTHDYLISDGYYLRDGLHFDTQTTLKIYNYILSNLK